VFREQECVLIIISTLAEQVLAPYTPYGGGCQRFMEPVLSPLLYNSNLLSVKGIFEGAKIRKYGYFSAWLRMDFILGCYAI